MIDEVAARKLYTAATQFAAQPFNKAGRVLALLPGRQRRQLRWNDPHCPYLDQLVYVTLTPSLIAAVLFEVSCVLR